MSDDVLRDELRTAIETTWATEATDPAFDAVVADAITYEWLEGGRFPIQRSRHEHEAFPDAICVIGAPEEGDGLVMEYFDSRGVRRTYGVSLEPPQVRPRRRQALRRRLSAWPPESPRRGPRS